jgi:hypothetical protein
MRTYPASYNRDMERLLAGGSSAMGDSEPVQRFVQDLRTAFPEEPIDAAVAEGHLTAMFETARLLGAEAQPSTGVIAGARPVATTPERRRRLVFGELLGSLKARVAAGSIASLTAFSGAAVAGVLPDPVQSFVADVASGMGLDLPRPGPARAGIAGDDQTEDVDPPSGTEDEKADTQEPRGPAGNENDSEDRRDPEGRKNDEEGSGEGGPAGDDDDDDDDTGDDPTTGGGASQPSEASNDASEREDDRKDAEDDDSEDKPSEDDAAADEASEAADQAEDAAEDLTQEDED